mmetsp:Transcript_5862/g.9464  ORF Transcript_5862/g.9464 Transcript_5862/m.9464 type:complete len:134 (+) Transcript_5862:3827-4228(+)
MANIDNAKIFKRDKEATRENTLFIVYRAERLYSALGDAEKIFKHLSKHIFDKDEFEKVQLKPVADLSKQESTFLRKRDQGVRRLLSLVSNFLNQYSIFSNSFMFKKVHIKDYLSQELETVSQVTKSVFESLKQ